MAEIPGEGELEYTLTLRGEGFLGPMSQAEVSCERLNVKAQQMSVTVQRTGRDMDRAGKGAIEASTRFRMLGGVLVGLSIQAFVLGLIFRRMRHLTYSVSQGQKNLNEAIKEHGLHSEEAREAQERLNLAMEDLRWSQAEQVFYLVLSSAQMGIMLVRMYEIIAGQKIMTATTHASSTAHVGATITVLGHTIALKKLAIALGFATAGLAILAGGLAVVAMQSHSAKAEAEALKQTIGERPSYGLVKSFEDLSSVVRETRLSLGGVRIEIGGREEVSRKIDEFARYLKNEIWRASA